MKILNQYKNTWFQMKKSSEKSGEVLIYNDIGMWGINENDFANALKDIGEVDSLTVRINSYGGEVFTGFAIYNRIKEHSAKNKIIIIDGIAASIASVIALAGTELQMAKNSFLMVHNPSVFVGGTSDDLRKSADLLDKLKEVIVSSYKEKAKNLSEKELSDMMDEETWISADDGLKYGFADKVIDFSETDEPETNSTKKLPENLKSILLATDKIPNGMQAPYMKGNVMKICPHCGKDHAEGAVYCGHCGKAIAQAIVKPEDKVANEVALKAAHDKEVKEAVACATKRVTDITEVCRNLNLSIDYAEILIKSDSSFEDCAKKAIEKSKENSQYAPILPLVTKDESDKFRDHNAKSLQCALGIEKDSKVIDEIKRNPGARDLHGLARAALTKEGRLTAYQIATLSPSDLYRETIRMSMSSSDLPSILADTMNKEFLGAFEESGATFRTFVKETETADFRAKSFTKMSGFGDIDDLPEGMPFKEGKLSDKKESLTLSTKGKKISATRNLIINNDTDALLAFPRVLGTAVYRRLNKDVYDMLTSASLLGPTMTEDSVAVFNYTSHNNLKATSGVLSVSSLGTAEQMLMETPLLKPTNDQTSKMYGNYPAKYLVTGTNNRISALQLLGSPIDPAATDGKQVVNPYNNGQVTPVFDPYLQYLLTTANVASAFYLFTGQNIQPNLTVMYLSGNRAPTLRNEPSGVGEALGIEWDIFFDWIVGFQDWRGVVYSDGATGG